MIADRLYLDHAATTPIIAAARDAISDAMARWANPSSPHAEGRAAKAALEDARARVKAALAGTANCCSPAVPAKPLVSALRDFDSIASAVEHDAVLAAVGQEGRLRVDANGIVHLPSIASNRRYAIQQVNNETGIIQPLAALSAEIRQGGGLLFADCSQGWANCPCPMQI